MARDRIDSQRVERVSLFEGKNVEWWDTSLTGSPEIQAEALEEGTQVAFLVVGKIAEVRHGRDRKTSLLKRTQHVNMEQATQVPVRFALDKFRQIEAARETEAGITRLPFADDDSLSVSFGSEDTTILKTAVKHLRDDDDKYVDPSEIHASDPALTDELIERAKVVVIDAQVASISMLMRKLGIGHARATQVMAMLEDDGVVGEQRGTRPRVVLVQNGDER